MAEQLLHPYQDAEAVDPKETCGLVLSERPSWMGVDQYEPCPCIKPLDHPGEPHRCACGVLKEA